MLVAATNMQWANRFDHTMTARRREPSKTPPSSGGGHRHLHSRVTIRDVAEQAGVSLGTASNVLNRRISSCPETLTRVLTRSSSSLGFVRSSAAHQMRGGKAAASVLSSSTRLTRSRPRRFAGSRTLCNEQGCAVVVCSTDGSPEREARYLRLLEEQRVQGIVITPTTRSIRHLETLRDRGTLVVLPRPAQQRRRTLLGSVDHAAAASSRHGISSTSDTAGSRPSTVRFTSPSAPSAGVGCVRRAPKPQASRPTRASSSTRSIRSQPSSRPNRSLTPFSRSRKRRPQWCASTIESRSQSWRTLADRRVRVPRDISVVGYDDVEFASMFSPTLTSIRAPKYELGRAAAQLLIDETVDPQHRHGNVRFEPELIARQSTTARAKLKRYSPAW